MWSSCPFGDFVNIKTVLQGLSGASSSAREQLAEEFA